MHHAGSHLGPSCRRMLLDLHALAAQARGHKAMVTRPDGARHFTARKPASLCRSSLTTRPTQGSCRRGSSKGIPLPLFPRIGSKCVAEPVRNLRRDHRAASRKRRHDGPTQPRVFDVECARQHPNVVVVLHAAVGPTQDHHRVKLLGDDSLWRISAQVW